MKRKYLLRVLLAALAAAILFAAVTVCAGAVGVSSLASALGSAGSVSALPPQPLITNVASKSTAKKIFLIESSFLVAIDNVQAD